MKHLPNTFSILLLFTICLTESGCVKNISWSDYMEQFSSNSAQKQYAEAKKRLGADHPDMWWYLNNIGESYHREAMYDKAELYYQRANDIAEKTLGNGYSYVPLSFRKKGKLPNTSDNDVPPKSLENLAALYQTEGKYPQAEMLYDHWAKLLEQQFGPSNRSVAKCLINLSELYREESKHKLADDCEKKAELIEHQSNLQQKDAH